MERMISLERCRKLLGPKEAVSDESLVTLRDQLYCFAELILEVRDRGKEPDTLGISPFEQAATSPEELEILRERAAIIEFEGNVSRDEAERLAISSTLASERLN